MQPPKQSSYVKSRWQASIPRCSLPHFVFGAPQDNIQSEKKLIISAARPHDQSLHQRDELIKLIRLARHVVEPRLLGGGDLLRPRVPRDRHHGDVRQPALPALPTAINLAAPTVANLPPIAKHNHVYVNLLVPFTEKDVGPNSSDRPWHERCFKLSSIPHTVFGAVDSASILIMSTTEETTTAAAAAAPAVEDKTTETESASPVKRAAEDEPTTESEPKK